jgi:hypothetical protein
MGKVFPLFISRPDRWESMFCDREANVEQAHRVPNSEHAGERLSGDEDEGSIYLNFSTDGPVKTNADRKQASPACTVSPNQLA